ncbi:hypothetical protein [Rhodopseudomonas palustris]|uniref:hypothetical protein n=1 Tax=Rhodopseudomonas palustris TaxID=1076 RepID=UPI0014032327|nr:hypothetical protein [Rhodopseudomonas palustris]
MKGTSMRIASAVFLSEQYCGAAIAVTVGIRDRQRYFDGIGRSGSGTKTAANIPDLQQLTDTTTGLPGGGPYAGAT